MEAVSSRLESFTKARRVKHSSTKRTVSLKWPHPTHFTATPQSLTEAGFFFNPSWDARDNVECFFCGKCLDGWEEKDDPHAIHWDKCRDTCAWAVVRCGINDDLDHKGSFASKDPSRQPDGKSMEKARLATFRSNDTWPHDHVKGHSANSTKMAKAGFVFTPQTPGDDTGTCLYCHVSLNGWDEGDNPLEEHRKRVKKSKLSCPFFPDAPAAPKARSRTTSSRSTARPQSRAGSKQLRSAASETSLSRSDDDSQPAPPAPPPRPAQRNRTTSTVSTAKAQDSSDALRRSTRSSRAKPTSEVEEDASGTEVRRSTLGHSLSKSSGKGKGRSFIEVIEEADEDDMPRAALPAKQRGKGKENVAHDVKVPRATRNTRPIRTTDTEEEAPQPKRRLPKKKSRAALDVREDSPPDVDSESDVRHAGKQYRVVESVSSQEESAEEIKPKKVRAAVKKTKAKPPIDMHEPEDEQVDVTEGPSLPVKKVLRKAPRAKRKAIEDSDEGSNDDPEEVGQTAQRPSLDRDENARSHAPLKSPDAAASQSSEEAVIPFLASEKNTDKGKGFKPASATASNHERGRSQATSDSDGSPKPLMAKSDTNAASGAARDLQNDVMDIDSDVASVPITPPRKITALLEKTSSVNVDSGVFAPRTRPHSPEATAAPALRREESPATPPPASSSLLSMSSTTSTTKVEGHTDTETLVEPVPLRTNGAQLTEEERVMTVEQWIRREIEMQYELLRGDGEMKIRQFKERAEEVRRQIEAL